MQKTGLLRKLKQLLEQDTPIPRTPLLELVGDERILVEHYRQILLYEPLIIRLEVRFGQLTIEGEGLSLVQMTDQKLVICGKIRSVSIDRE